MHPITFKDGSFRNLGAKLEMVFLFPEEVDDQLGLVDDRITNENVLEARVDLARVHQFGPLDDGSSSGTFLATDPWTPRPRF